ncbi:MAG: mannose-6-phosphate isomerase, class I [Acidimicrobiia bacterium]|nr:mannose-6-phosphate isomerase, class I [Acidimicrobiia bacterium]
MDKLVGEVQHYAWGDRRHIAELQGRTPGPEPEAELWFGAHPVAPSLIGADRSLLDAVDEQPAALLGPTVYARFGQFPFLLKILAAAEPLSIQVHPSLAQARAGYHREDAEGIPRDSPSRTYRDDNHKPELICALTEFEAKCGFRPLPATRLLIGALADGGGRGLLELSRRLGDGSGPSTSLLDALAWLLRIGPTDASSVASEAVAAAERLLARGLDPALTPFERDLRWTAELNRYHPGDAGVVVALLLNHVVLQPGEAVFLGAGNLHSYLRGVGVELMANSDNVIRGGLTVKHVDVDELLTVVDLGTGPAPIQTPVGCHHRFQSPTPEFSLTRAVGAEPGRFEPSGPEIVLVTEGAVVLEGPGTAGPLRLRAGEAALVAFVDGPYHFRPEGSATFWRATVGDLGD